MDNSVGVLSMRRDYRGGRCRESAGSRGVKCLLALKLLRQFLALVSQVVRPLQFMQLCRIALGKLEPTLETLLGALCLRHIKTFEKRLDGEVIAHRVALDDTPNAADIFWFSLAVMADNRKTEFAAAERCKIAGGSDTAH